MIISSLSKEAKHLFWLCVLGGSLILACGLLSDLYLGDETFHFRIASYIYKANFKRPLYDPLALTNPVGKSYYVDPMFWHYALALFWRLTGGVSKAVAQIYQILWFVILVISTYLLGKEFRDRKTGFYAALLVSTMLFTSALSIILHTDIPVAAATTLSFLLLVKRQFFWAAVSMAVMCYVKKNSYMLLPAFVIFSLYFMITDKEKKYLGVHKILGKWILVFVIPFFIIVLPEIAYRDMTFGIHSFWSGNIRRPDYNFKPIIFDILSNTIKISLKRFFIPLQSAPQTPNIVITQPQVEITAPRADMPAKAEIVTTQPTVEIPAPQVKTTPPPKVDISLPQTQSLVTSQPQVEITASRADMPAKAEIGTSKADIPPQFEFPTSDIKYRYTEDEPFKFYDESNLLIDPFVFFKYFGIAVISSLFFYFFKLAVRKKDALLWFLIITYIPIYFFIFKGGLNVRYLSPIIGYMAVIGGIGLSSLKTKWIRYIIIVGCIIQMISASAYTFINRKIPLGIKETYVYIKSNTAEDARVMCSKNALSLYSNRCSIWLGVPALHELGFLFWQANPNEMLDIFNKYDIDYILIEKDKIYDDIESRHTGGYPKSFVDRLPSMKIFDLILENDSAMLWKIKR